MNDILNIVLSGVAGLGLGTFFFYGLWLTVRKTLTTSSPAIWMLGSFVVRMGITVMGFCYAGNGNWQRFLASLLGFIVARYIIIYLARRAEARITSAIKSISHAS
jgi:F1F0 ATPase subunit 2